jgi:hypothetical protein
VNIAGPLANAPEAQTVGGGNFGPGSQGFFSDLGFNPVASQMGLGVVNSGPVATNGMTLGQLQNMQANGLGKMDISPTQTVDQAIAALNVSSISPSQIASMLGLINPAFGAAVGLANTGMGLLSGQTTVGQAVANLGLTAVAQAINVNPSVLAGIVNANPGQTIAGLMGPAGAVISGGLSVLSPSGSPNSSLSGAINNALGVTPQNTISTIANAINSSIGGGNMGPTAMASAAPSQALSASNAESPAQGTATASSAPGGGSFNLSELLGGLSLAGLGAMRGNSGESDGSPFLDTRAQVLKSNVPEQKPNTPEILKLAQLQNIYDRIDPDLLSLLVERGAVPAAAGGSIHQFASGGSPDKTCSMWGSLSKYAPKTVPATATTISTGPSRRPKHEMLALKQMNAMGGFGGMAKGGLPAKYREAAPDGHNPEFITGLTGFYANGRGTGQSDDIPAMLHDGDYVMDADTVAAFGDGSSKAGAQAMEALRSEVPHQMAEGGKAVPAKIADGEYVFPEAFVTALGNGDNKRGAKMLDVMRENLRAHKRSAPTSKIPPKALSPLDYLQKAKG